MNRHTLTFASLQREVAEWSGRNFPGKRPHQPLLGAVEEVGELAEADQGQHDAHIRELTSALGRLAHAHLKREQGIRGTAEVHLAAQRDAVADVVIYLADYCEQNQISFQATVQETWAQVKLRNWVLDPVTGMRRKEV